LDARVDRDGMHPVPLWGIRVGSGMLELGHLTLRKQSQQG